jgi:lysophospholipase L1-like esterase
MAAPSNPSPRKKRHWYTVRWQVAVILVVAWYFLIGRYRHSIGSGPAGPAVSRVAFQQPWATNRTVLLGIGDSITAGFGASAKHGYFELLLQNDDQGDADMEGRDLRHVLPDLIRLNLSVSGSTSAEHLHDQLPTIRPFPANVQGIVVITTGGNDLIHDYGRSKPKDGAMYGCTAEQARQWKEAFRGRLEAILSGVAAKFPGGCEIFLANIYDPTDDVGDIQHATIVLPAWPGGRVALESFNAVIADACQANLHVHLVDLHGLFLGHGIHCANMLNPHYHSSDPHYWYFDNLEDPNDRGFDAIRRAFLIEMGKVFAPTGPPETQRTQLRQR